MNKEIEEGSISKEPRQTGSSVGARKRTNTRIARVRKMELNVQSRSI